MFVIVFWDILVNRRSDEIFNDQVSIAKSIWFLLNPNTMRFKEVTQ